MLVSLVMTTFQRSQLLKLTLPSILNQVPNLPFDIEIIVVNDGLPDDTEVICNANGAKYIFTGQRNLKHIHWRIPGFALNIGVKAAQGEILVLSCAEMYHIGSVLVELVKAVNSNPLQNLAVPEGKDDSGLYLRTLRITNKHSEQLYPTMTKLNTKLPFLMAMSKSLYMQLGGYDEDFIGQAFDDNDFIDRLLAYGCKHIHTKARCVHLYHTRSGPGRSRKLHEYNRRLYEARKGIIIRNVGKEWGAFKCLT